MIGPISLDHHRAVKEWVGKNADSLPPIAVKLRVFARYEGRCHLTGVKIQTGDDWDVEHVKPLHLAQPGENLNRESNLAPALRVPHREKTAAENSAKSKADRIRAKHLGIAKPSTRPLKRPKGMKFDWSTGRYVRTGGDD